MEKSDEPMENVHQFKFDYYKGDDALPFSFEYDMIKVKGKVKPGSTVADIFMMIIDGLNTVAESESLKCPECDKPFGAKDRVISRESASGWRSYHAECLKGLG